jgi:hypothetical protein
VVEPGLTPTGASPAFPNLRPVPGGQDETDAEALYAGLEAGTADADAQLRKIYDGIRRASTEGRELLEQGWWQKLLYCHGRQWIHYTSRSGWQDKRLARWIPRPVTNVTFDTISTIRSMLSNVEPGVRVKPNGQEPKNVLAAQTADDMEPVIYEEHKMQRVFFEADFWAPTLGTVFLHPHWDNDDPNYRVFVQALQCPTCGFQCHPLDVSDGTIRVCPQDGQTPGDAFQLATDPNGKAIGQYENVGCGRTDVVSTLEILIPTHFQRWGDVDRLIRLRWRPKEYYEGRPYFNQLRFQSSTSEKSLMMFRSLSMLTDMTTSPFQPGGAQPTRAEGLIEAELWINRCSQFPDGLWARLAGGNAGQTVIIRDDDRGIQPGPLPYSAPIQPDEETPRKLWPWIYYPYEEIGGRIWGKSALDPVIPKNDSINRNDSMVELIMQRMANPIWLEPKGSEVQRFTGEPGLIVRYGVVAGTNAKPERLEGLPLNQSHFQLREQYFSDVERLSKTRDILKGGAPPNVDSFSGLNLLVEQSQNGFISLFKQRGRAYRDWYAVALDLERVYGPEQRVRTVQGNQGKFSYLTFKRADLQGAITVVIEDGSQTPKTSLGRRAAAQQAQQMGSIDMTDPATKARVNDLMGVHDLAPGLDAHTKAAATELELYERWVAAGRLDPATGQPSQPPPEPTPMPGQPQPPPQPLPGNPLVVQAWNNHPIHIEQLDIWANSDRIRQLVMTDPIAKAEITFHRVQHIVANANQFGLPVPPPVQAPPPDQPKVTVSLNGQDPLTPLVLEQAGIDVAPQQPMPGGPAGAPQHAPFPLTSPSPNAMPAGKPAQPQGAARAMANSNQESGAIDTMPGQAPGGGNMSPPR